MDYPSPNSSSEARAGLEGDLDVIPLGGASRRASTWMLIATASVAISQFAIFTLVARELGPDAAGEYGLALAVVAPLSLLLGMSLRSVLQAQGSSWRDFRALLGLRIVASSGLVLVCSAFMLFPALPGEAILLLGLARAFDLVGDLVAGEFLRRSMPAQAALPIAANQVASIVVFVLAISALGSLELALFGSAVASLAASCLLPVVLLRHERGPGQLAPILGWSDLRRWAIAGGTLGLAASVTALAAMTPRFALGLQGGSEEVGEYTAAFAICSLPAVLYAAIVQGHLTPLRLAWDKVSQRSVAQAVRSCIGLTLGVGIATSLVMLLMPVTLLTLVYGEDFVGAAQTLQVLALSNLLASIVWGLDVVLTAGGQFRLLLKVNVVALIVVVTLSMVLVSRYGQMGAAWAFSAGLALGLILKAARYWWLVR